MSETFEEALEQALNSPTLSEVIELGEICSQYVKEVTTYDDEYLLTSSVYFYRNKFWKICYRDDVCISFNECDGPPKVVAYYEDEENF